jgi:hypothetical protein
MDTIEYQCTTECKAREKSHINWSRKIREAKDLAGINGEWS